MDMINLDDKQAVMAKQGGEATLTSINSLPQQLDQSFNEVLALSFPESFKSVKNVVVCGMGGSRFPALILQHLYKTSLKIPYVINDDYNLPDFINEETLVILSSYSGTTEEVIECGKKAQKKGAKLTGLCVGGEIASFLKETKNPVYVFDPKFNPSGQPRIGFGYGVGGHLGFLVALGLIDETADAVNATIKKLPSMLSLFLMEVGKKNNPAKQLAEKLYEQYPYFVVSEFLTGVGNAVQNQINETAKNVSSFRIVPELNHHLMEGLKHPTPHTDMAIFVLFFSRLYSERIQKRFKITKDVVEQNKLKTVWHELQGETELEQVLELMGLGSYTSMYLAALYEENPNAIPYVDYFKEQLSK